MGRYGAVQSVICELIFRDHKSYLRFFVVFLSCPTSISLFIMKVGNMVMTDRAYDKAGYGIFVRILGLSPSLRILVDPISSASAKETAQILYPAITDLEICLRRCF